MSNEVVILEIAEYQSELSLGTNIPLIRSNMILSHDKNSREFNSMR